MCDSGLKNEIPVHFITYNSNGKTTVVTRLDLKCRKWFSSNFTHCPLVWHFCGKQNDGKIEFFFRKTVSENTVWWRIWKLQCFCRTQNLHIKACDSVLLNVDMNCRNFENQATLCVMLQLYSWNVISYMQNPAIRLSHETQRRWLGKTLVKCNPCVYIIHSHCSIWCQ